VSWRARVPKGTGPRTTTPRPGRNAGVGEKTKRAMVGFFFSFSFFFLLTLLFILFGREVREEL
jgi:hypothetical protein